MSFESKRDIAAGVCMALMFAGAFMLTVTPIGFALMGAGALTMVALLIGSLRKRG